MESAQGTIIRLTKLTESSLIVSWLTEDHGLIKTVAKGARQAKSSFAGQIDLFVEAEFEWHRSQKSELHRLSEVNVLNHRYDLRKNYRDTLTAGYFGQLLEMVFELNHPEPEMYELLQRGLAWLGEKGAHRKGVFHFENEVARLLGIGNEGVNGILVNYNHMPKCRDHCLDLLK